MKLFCTEDHDTTTYPASLPPQHVFDAKRGYIDLCRVCGESERSYSCVDSSDAARLAIARHDVKKLEAEVARFRSGDEITYEANEQRLAMESRIAELEAQLEADLIAAYGLVNTLCESRSAYWSAQRKAA